MVEILLAPVHIFVMLPGLGDSDHHRKRKIHAVHVHEFESIIQHCGVGTAGTYNGIDLIQILLEYFADHSLFSGKHTVDITSYGIDLTVMSDHPVRMCLLP